MENYILNYNKPAKAWYEALPMGNGSIGAMSYGRFKNESIELNLDTLWSGDGKSNLNGNAVNWTYFRELILNEQYSEAETYCKENILGDWTAGYLPSGTLNIDFKNINYTSSGKYKRALSLNDATETLHYSESGKNYQREMFVSISRPVMAVHFHSDSRMNLEISLKSDIHHKYIATDSSSDIVLTGQAPVYVAPPYYSTPDPIVYEQGKGIRYLLSLHADAPDGNIKNIENKLIIDARGDIYIYLSGATDFEQKTSWNQIMSDCIYNARSADYDKLKKQHLNEYHGYFNRMELTLGSDINKKEELMFHYARYLMICSSKCGTECSNLQGIWNNNIRAPWSSNYTVNINTQMNYWIAERCNLSEFHQPLFSLIERAASSGKETAMQLYGLNGWVSHHNIDIWGHSAPVGHYGQDSNPCSYSMWAMSSGWLCRHLWEHYKYTLDEDFLRDRAYPIIEGAVQFYLDFLIPYGEYMVSCPSTSPENMFIACDNSAHSLTIASTMDICIIKELFESYLDMCSILGITGLSDKVLKTISRLPPLKIGKQGQLQEWFFDFPEHEPHHRHVSHLYGLYPGNTIYNSNSDILDSCRKALELRGDEGTGWCMAWKACLWARLGDGEHALNLLQNQLRPSFEDNISCVGGGIYPNMLCAHPPFQIDGNFGFAAAMTEMLLQYRHGKLIFLPALPKKWSSGKIQGMKTEGGFTVGFEWKNRRIIKIHIKSIISSSLTIEYNGKTQNIIFDENNTEFIHTVC